VLDYAWFQCVWVYQEFAIVEKARVFVGQDSMLLEDLLYPLLELGWQPLSRRMSRLSAGAYANLAAFGLFLRDYEEWRTTGRRSSWKLLDLVGNSCLREATNAQDRIYAFTTLASDVKPSDWEVIPDYTAPVEEAYLRFARWCLLRNGDLDLLRFCNHDEKRPARRLPSWVPDWKVSITMRTASLGSNAVRGPFSGAHAPVGSEPWVSWRPDEPDILQIKGAIVDHIEQVSITKYHIMRLESFEERTGIKFGTPKAAKLLKHFDEQVMRHANPDSAGRGEEQLTELLEEAAAASERFCSTAIPKHKIVNIVWIENCKHIASSGTGRLSKAQLDVF
jgi:hypothetical protein